MEPRAQLMRSGPMEIDVAMQFSPYPIGRSERDGEYSGERFRREFLVPALREATANGSRVIVNIDGVRTFGSSFLEEAFGGLVRDEGFTVPQLERALRIAFTKDYLGIYRDAIADYIREATPLQMKCA